MRKYVEPKSPEEALKRLRSAINYICRGKINDYKPEAVKLLKYLEGGLISLQAFYDNVKAREALTPADEVKTESNG